jgi:hypothetical protein
MYSTSRETASGLELVRLHRPVTQPIRGETGVIVSRLRGGLSQPSDISTGLLAI